MEAILSKLSDLEDQRGFRILYACESGSRAWGFASADSDYDVRFLYVWPEDAYLAIHDPAETCDLGVDAENHDLAGWDLRKSLRLMVRSNPVLLEWLHSPIVYREEPVVMNRWREMAKRAFVPRKGAGHYLGLGKKIWFGALERDEVTAKKYLYALRAVFGARWVLEKGTPIPVAFAELRDGLTMDDALSTEIDSLIAEKASGAEKAAIPRIGRFDELIREELARLGAEVELLPEEPRDSEDVSTFFREVIRREN